MGEDHMQAQFSENIKVPGGPLAAKSAATFPWLSARAGKLSEVARQVVRGHPRPIVEAQRLTELPGKISTDPEVPDLGPFRTPSGSPVPRIWATCGPTWPVGRLGARSHWLTHVTLPDIAENARILAASVAVRGHMNQLMRHSASGRSGGNLRARLDHGAC